MVQKLLFSELSSMSLQIMADFHQI